MAGILAWPYIDCQCGLSFHCICPAAIDGESWVTHERDESLFAIIRAGAHARAIWCPTGIDPHALERFTYEADKAYAPESPAVLELRDMKLLDPIRHPLFPDDVQAPLPANGSAKPELIWLRLCDLRDDTVFGTLLNEPEQALGVHAGDVLPLAFRGDDERGIAAACCRIRRNDSRVRRRNEIDDTPDPRRNDRVKVSLRDDRMPRMRSARRGCHLGVDQQ